MFNIMILEGGWQDHNLERVGDFLETCLSSDYRVSRSSDLNILRPDILSSVDVLIMLWTFGEITDEQTHTLINAVQGGMGLMAWHGAASAFLSNRPYKFLLGGQFVDHPGGDNVAYRVNFSDDALTDGIADIDVITEQYYFLVDPSVQIIAKTHIQCKASHGSTLWRCRLPGKEIGERKKSFTVHWAIEKMILIHHQ